MAARSGSGSTGSEAADAQPASSGAHECDEDRLRRRQIAGILILAAAILVLAVLRARWHDLFPQGWWRW